MNRPHAKLRSHALSLPGVDEGVACAGTALEKRTLRVGKKSFLFLRPVDAMFKLGGSLDEARELARLAPAACKVGASGWVTITFAAAGSPAAATLSRWIAESHALLGGGGSAVAQPVRESGTAQPGRARKAARIPRPTGARSPSRRPRTG